MITVGQGLTVTWRLRPLPHARQQMAAAVRAGCPRAAGWQARQIVRLHRAELEAGGLLRPAKGGR